MNKIAITGVTGQLGRLVVKHLLERGVAAEQIRGVAHDPQKAADLIRQGIEIVQGDYDEATSLYKAFEGVSKLLFISASSLDSTVRVRQHATVVEAARNAKVGQIIYTGIAFGEKMKIGLENVHLATEYMIKTTQLPYTFLRNAFYMEILVNPGLAEIVASGELVTSVPTGKMNYVTRNDLALAAAVVLNSERHENKIYELVNPHPFSYDEFAAILSEVAGKAIKHRAVSPEEALQAMVQTGVPAPRAGFMVNLIYAAIESGQFASTSGDLMQLLGNSYKTTKEAVQQILKE